MRKPPSLPGFPGEEHLADLGRLLAEGACRDAADKDIFYPDSYRRSSVAAEARAYCRRCGVVLECLLFALATEDASGIWGGLTPWQRGRLRSVKQLRQMPPFRVGREYLRHNRFYHLVERYLRADPSDRAEMLRRDLQEVHA